MPILQVAAATCPYRPLGMLGSHERSVLRHRRPPGPPLSDFGQVRQDDSGHDLGHHHPQEALQ